MALLLLRNVYALCCIILIATTSAQSAYGKLFDSTNYPPEPICKKESATVMSQYTVVQLKCQWRSFLNYIYQKLEESASENQEKTDTLFDIEFENTRQEATKGINQNEINETVFSLFKLRKLIARKLNLSSVTLNAFSKCCENLEVLDLSKNNLTRIDKETLEPLKNLRVLQLSENRIQVENNNFEHNKMLEELLVRESGIQYLPEKLFNGLDRLTKIDFTNNGFRTVKACMFSSLRTFRNKSEPNVKTRIIMNANPIDCDHEVFYLGRVPNFGVEIVCARPEKYSHRYLDDLLIDLNETFSVTCDEDPKPATCTNCSTCGTCPSCDYLRTANITLILFLVLFILLAGGAGFYVLYVTKLKVPKNKGSNGSKEGDYRQISTENPDSPGVLQPSVGSSTLLNTITRNQQQA